MRSTIDFTYFIPIFVDGAQEISMNCRILYKRYNLAKVTKQFKSQSGFCILLLLRENTSKF